MIYHIYFEMPFSVFVHNRVSLGLQRNFYISKSQSKFQRAFYTEPLIFSIPGTLAACLSFFLIQRQPRQLQNRESSLR